MVAERPISIILLENPLKKLKESYKRRKVTVKDMDSIHNNEEEEEESRELLFPIKPSEPLDSECCGTGCSPCVFDIYQKQLKKWEEECLKIKQQLVDTTITKNSCKENSQILQENHIPTSSVFLTPEEYHKFNLVSIVPDSSNDCFIYSFAFEKLSSNNNNNNNNMLRPSIELGQHVVIKLTEKYPGKQYTVLKIGEDHVDILIKIYPNGLVTPLIKTLNMGDSVLIRGPFGKVFNIQLNQYKLIIMFASGTGICPMYRIIESILSNEEDNTKIKLIFSTSSPKRILLKSKIKEWISYWNFEIVHYFSKCTLAESKEGYYGIKAHAKTLNFTDFQLECKSDNHGNSYDLQNCLFLVCGTKSYEKDMLNYLNKLKVPEKNYHIF